MSYKLVKSTTLSGLNTTYYGTYRNLWSQFLSGAASASGYLFGTESVQDSSSGDYRKIAGRAIIDAATGLTNNNDTLDSYRLRVSGTSSPQVLGAFAIDPINDIIFTRATAYESGGAFIDRIYKYNPISGISSFNIGGSYYSGTDAFRTHYDQYNKQFLVCNIQYQSNTLEFRKFDINGTLLFSQTFTHGYPANATILSSNWLTNNLFYVVYYSGTWKYDVRRITSSTTSTVVSTTGVGYDPRYITDITMLSATQVFYRDTSGNAFVRIFDENTGSSTVVSYSANGFYAYSGQNWLYRKNGNNIEILEYDLTNNVFNLTSEAIDYNGDVQTWDGVMAIDKKNFFIYPSASTTWNAPRIGIVSNASLPSVVSDAVDTITKTSFNGNGQLTSNGGRFVFERGFCYKSSTIAGDPTISDSTVFDSGSKYANGSYSKAVSALAQGEKMKVRAYAKSDIGVGYGSLTYAQLKSFLNPAYAYADDSNYTTIPSTTGKIRVALSQDGGLNYSAEKIIQLTGAETNITVGTLDLWGLSWTGTEADNSKLKVRIRLDEDVTLNDQVYGNFGFSIPSGYYLTGLEIKVKGLWDGSLISINNIACRIAYGNSPTPVIEGSMSYAANGRKASETAGNGKGVPCFWDSKAVPTWCAVDTGLQVSA